MSDMTAVIAPKSDQINADDLITGPLTITVEAVSVRPGTEQPVSIAIAGNRKVYRPCKSMMRVMVNAWGADSAKYVGQSMTLYRDPKVKWGGAEIGGIRISAISGIASEMVMALSESKAVRKRVVIKPLATVKPSPAAPIPSAAAETPSTDAGQSAGAASNEASDPAADYAAGIMDKISAAETVDELDVLLEQARKKLARRTELLAGIETAVGFKVAFLNGVEA